MELGREEHLNRAERARDYFLKNVGRHVTKRELSEAGVDSFYVVRNAVSEAKPLMPEEYEIIPERTAEDQSDTCGYRCVKKEPISGEAKANLQAGAVDPRPIVSPSPVYFVKKQGVFDFGNLAQR